MQELKGYVIAQSIDPEKDTLGLVDPIVYFNLADAMQQAQPHENILQVIIPFPQDGKGNPKQI